MSPWTKLGLKTHVYSELSNTFFNNNLDLLFDEYICIPKKYIQNAIIKYGLFKSHVSSLLTEEWNANIHYHNEYCPKVSNALQMANK